MCLCINQDTGSAAEQSPRCFFESIADRRSSWSACRKRWTARQAWIE
jgi:hypothetical protein